MTVTINGTTGVVSPGTENFETLTPGANVSIDVSSAQNFLLSLDQDTTVTFTNAANTGFMSSCSLKVVQDTTTRQITWTNVEWQFGTEPVLTPTSGAVDFFVFLTHDGGTTWYGFTAGKDMS